MYKQEMKTAAGERGVLTCEILLCFIRTRAHKEMEQSVPNYYNLLRLVYHKIMYHFNLAKSIAPINRAKIFISLMCALALKT